MILILGYLIVLGATLGGFLEAGGKIGLLFPISEYIIIIGISIGLMVIASPVSLLKNIVKKIKVAFRNQAVPTSDYTDLLKLLYELFSKARRGGLIAIEDDVMAPKDSPILSKYPSFINDRERLEFLTNSLKPVIDGRLKPEQLGGLLHADFEAKEEDAVQPVHILNLIGDSLPGIGIVAAVMGIINTMAAIAMGPEKVGAKVASALVGTFLGVLGAYGFINPLAARIKLNNVYELQYFAVIMKGVLGFTGGMAPIMAIEAARRAIDPAFQPTAEAVEEMVKNIGTSGN
ncbi:MAG: flagellar motor stator protein MotA [Proteobacteria bacterium]|jgi:chemotaxis protein MotA|nr:flagellar motor stator protein MotA [Pseudomonadota bacterium]